MTEQEVIEAITTSYPPWVQKLFVTSNIKAIQDALNVLSKLEAIDSQHNNPQLRSNENRSFACSNYNREEYREGRTHSVRQTYVNREQRRIRNSVYPEQQSCDRQETYGSSGGNRRNYSPRRNMATASALDPEARPYNQDRTSQGNETDNMPGNSRRTE
jgi:carboxypeptidase C (cathepsin A)